MLLRLVSLFGVLVLLLGIAMVADSLVTGLVVRAPIGILVILVGAAVLVCSDRASQWLATRQDRY